MIHLHVVQSMLLITVQIKQPSYNVIDDASLAVEGKMQKLESLTNQQRHDKPRAEAIHALAERRNSQDLHRSNAQE